MATYVNVKDLLTRVMERVQGCPTPTAINAYVDAAREFCGLSRLLTANIDAATEIDTPQYAMGNDPYIEVIGVRAMSVDRATNDWRPVTERSQTLFDRNAASDTPEFYAYLPEAQFVLHPTPNAVLPLKVTAVVQPKSTVTQIDASLLPRWEGALRAGALARLFAISGAAWVNPGEARRYETMFMAAVFSASASVSSGNNPGSAATDRPGGPNARARGRIQPI